MHSCNLVMIVMLVKHEKPTDYKEAMVDPSPKNGYEPYIIRDRIHVCLPSGDLENLLDGLHDVEERMDTIK